MLFAKSHAKRLSEPDDVENLPDLNPDTLGTERKARKSVDKWRQLKHRRAAKCAENRNLPTISAYTPRTEFVS